jgi:hypothetical protein
MVHLVEAKTVVFIVGVIVGPAVGLIGGEFIFGPNGPGPRLATVALSLFLIFVLLAPRLDLGLKLGLVMGILLGVLLSLTPPTSRSGDEPA